MIAKFGLGHVCGGIIGSFAEKAKSSGIYHENRDGILFQHSQE